MPSTVIRSFNYDQPKKELLVVFQSGRSYIYRGVPRETYQAMKAAFAKGEYFNAHIRGRFLFTRTGSNAPFISMSPGGTGSTPSR